MKIIPDEKVIFEHSARCIKITVSNSACMGYANFLDEIVWGSNGPKFKFLTTEKKLSYLSSALFFTCYLKNEIAAIFTLTIKNIQLNSNKITSFYGRHFAVKNDVSCKGMGALLIKKSYQFFENEIGNTKGLFYAYIEDHNINSINVSNKYEIDKIGEFGVYQFNRLYPKDNLFIRKLNIEEAVQLDQQFLHSYHKDFTLKGNNIQSGGGDFWAYEKEGEILSVCRAFKHHWVLDSFPSKVLTLLLKSISYIPVIRKIFNAQAFFFLGIESLYFKNNPEEINILIEALLNRNKVNNAILYLDETNINHLEISKKINWGILHSLIGIKRGQVKAIPFNLDSNEIQELKSKSKYISSFEIG